MTPVLSVSGQTQMVARTTLRYAVTKDTLPYVDSLLCVGCGSPLVTLSGTPVDTEGVVAPNAKCPSCGRRFRFRDAEDTPA